MDLSYLLPNPNKKLTADKKKRTVSKVQTQPFLPDNKWRMFEKETAGFAFLFRCSLYFSLLHFALHGYVIPIRVVHALFVLDVPLLPSSNVHVLIQDVDH